MGFGQGAENRFVDLVFYRADARATQGFCDATGTCFSLSTTARVSARGGVGGLCPPQKPAASERVSAIYARAQRAKCVASFLLKARLRVLFKKIKKRSSNALSKKA